MTSVIGSASLSARDVNALLGVAVAVTGLCAGVSRYTEVVRGSSAEDLELATAFGFFVGLAAGILVVALLAIV